MVLISFRIYFLAFVIGYTLAYVNVALNKPTWQSNPYRRENIFDSSNAVDGRTSDLSGRGGQCTKSASKHNTTTWWVNLTSIYSIHDIWIYYRTNNDEWNAENTYRRRFLGFSIYVSNTTDRKDGHLCYHDTKYTSFTIPAVVNITCLVHGQYVIYYNERLSDVNYPEGYSKYAFNEICELEVYGCRIGYYGPNCSLPCPDKCHHCHIEIGICHLCESGYQGLQCEFDCRNEYYGSNCSLPCPENCRYCHKETGVWEWCEPGYKGYQCEIVSTEEDKVWQLRFYSTLGAVIVAVTLNAFFITIIICLKLKRNEPKVQQTKTESCFPEANHIYDNPDGNIPGEYQQLGKLGESSQYDALKQIDGEQNSENVKIK
ncbi:uncharacterized protein LOC134236042 isoform X1 [Saccostrea cucullata]|uniref:uncharacterized protein LOC134236042 isoform X1 n=1 Tax=Saccostrea cuccullata TaxID=36930 RepID=UPI002ED46384